MRLPKKELLSKLGVSQELGPYETFPWSCYDSETGQSCSAEVRMDPDGIELEAEVQMMYDEPPEGKLPMEQICVIRARPDRDDEWYVAAMTIRGEPVGDEIYNWQEKGCNFFNAVIQELQMDKIPDIDELLDREMHSRERMGDQRQGGGGKAPKIKTEQVMKRGGGF